MSPPPIVLRPFQAEMIEETRTALRTNRAVLIQLPTGGGKTVLSASMMRSAVEKGGRPWFVCHRDFLVDQTHLTLDRVGVPHGFIAAGRPFNPYAPAQVCSIDTLRNRLERVPVSCRPTVMFVDEGHHACSATWAKVIRWALDNGSRVVGLSATPERLDRKGLNELFGHMVRGPSVEWLIENKYLSTYNAFAPNIPDMEGVSSRGGDYATSELEEVMDNDTLTGSIVGHYQRLANSKRAVYFCVSVKHSQHVASAFNAAGVVAVHLDANSLSCERRSAARSMAIGELDVICNVGLFGEGYDLAAQAGMDVTIEAVGLCRPTQSLAMYMQQCLDSETEILTQRGWMRGNDVSGSDIVAAFDTATGYAEWVPILSRVSRPLALGEPMFGMSSPHLDFRVTGGHDMVVRANSASSVNWIKEPAERSALRSSMFRVPVSGTIPVSEEAPITDDEIRFIGWFLTDGTLTAKNQVSISQSASKPMHCSEISRVLTACGFKFGEYRIKRTGNYAHCADNIMFCVSKGLPKGTKKHLTGWAKLESYIDKSIGPAFDKLSARQFGVLIEAMNLGDGANQREVAWSPGTMSIAMGDNEVAADRIQALAIMRGFRCNKAAYVSAKGVTWWSLYIRQAAWATIAGIGVPNGSILGRKYARSRLAPVPAVEGEMVWCVENRLGTLFIRRNGKVAVVGNCGRALRPKDYPAVILDHAGNIARHGLPDDAREWTLEAKAKKKKGSPPVEPIRVCPHCFATAAANARVCPFCEEPYPVKEQRMMEENEDELVPVDKEALRVARARQEHACKSLDELIDVGRARGYSKPEAWAAALWTARARKRRQREEEADQQRRLW